MRRAERPSDDRGGDGGGRRLVGRYLRATFVLAAGASQQRTARGTLDVARVLMIGACLLFGRREMSVAPTQSDLSRRPLSTAARRRSPSTPTVDGGGFADQSANNRVGRNSFYIPSLTPPYDFSVTIPATAHSYARTTRVWPTVPPRAMIRMISSGCSRRGSRLRRERAAHLVRSAVWRRGALVASSTSPWVHTLHRIKAYVQLVCRQRLLFRNWQLCLQQHRRLGDAGKCKSRREC